ncbi:NfeD family protein [Aeromicrobium alkaliterrae]|uniref:NfeD-like C-terminal domain-containing protein n=1 Tax=Aeromicrobium alkaliterrae TaxID=302168 RepID=A0ABP4VJE5_9ACTN
MITFFVIGGIGIAILLLSIVIGDLFDGALSFLDVGGDLFSSAALGGFLGAFGFAGAIALDATDDLTASVGIGLVSGVVVGLGAGWASSRLQQGGDESTVRTSTLTGRTATVLNAIPAEGYGEVTIQVAGHITKLNARSAAPVAAGTPVTITAVLSATSVQVAPLEA